MRFKGGRNSGPEAGFDRKSQIRHRRENGSRMRAEVGKEHRRAAFLHDTISITVFNLGFWSHGKLSERGVKFSEWRRSGSHFSRRIVTLVLAENTLAPGRMSDTKPKKN